MIFSFRRSVIVAISLQKGQRVDVGLKKAGVGLGWDPNDSSGEDYDLDASIFLLASNKKIPSDDFLVYYNNLESKDKAVKSSGDDRTGGNSDGDDETITINFDKIDPKITELIVTVTIYEASSRGQNFGQVNNSFIRIYNPDTDEELCKYELGEDFSLETAVEFGRFYKKDGGWKFEAVGKGYTGGLDFFVKKYT